MKLAKYQFDKNNPLNIKVIDSTSEAIAYSPLILSPTKNALVAMGLETGTDLVGQTIVNKGDLSKIDLTDTALATATARIANGRGFLTTIGINGVTAYANAERKGGDSFEETKDSILFTTLGFGAGKSVEKTLEKVFPQSNMSSRVGDFIDSITSKSLEVNKEKNKDEKK